MAQKKANTPKRNNSKFELYKAAKAMVHSGLSIIPIAADATKRPAFELLPKVWSEKEQRDTRPWSAFKTRRPTIAELRGWFRDSDPDTEYGIAVIGGEVSGGLEIVDLDNEDIIQPWSDLVEEQAPGLLDRLVRVKSPRPGMHAYFRCREFGGSQKLTMVPDPAHGGSKPKTVIELKGAAGYCLAPPSPAACHKTNRPYVYASELDLTEVPTITKKEREALLSCARALNAWVRPRPQYSPKVRSVSGTALSRPGDAFNAQADWADILTPHGWTWLRETEVDSDQWCRPGKSEGVSGTTGFAGSDLLFVFSSNAEPFEQGCWYTKFHAYALLNHGGDFQAAARDLARQGYGDGRVATRRPDPYARYSDYVPRSLKETL
ncbi:bifunctional DNA primase/polymerase [Candidatus Uhrbacteria bacterium]|nr:bifunctional DNA primase/polymerase [Candidatus Uhrbacteria bacterium]